MKDPEARLLLPRLSVEECGRRWREVRQLMKRRRIDCLIVSGCSSGRADSGSAHMRYLSCIGGNGEEGYAVFPVDEEPTCFILTGSDWWWLRAQDWVGDIRRGFPDWAGNIATRIRELGSASSRIGVVGLSGMFWTDGNIPHTTFVKISKLLPHAKLIDATDVLEEVELTKSREEIQFHRRAAELGDLAINAMVKSAKPGVKEYRVYAEMVHAILANGGEHPVMILWEAGRTPRHPARFPTARSLRQGDIIVNEISSKYGGYWAHPHQPMAIGEPSREYRDMFQVCVDCYRTGLKHLVPGKTVQEVEDTVIQCAKDAGYIARVPLQGLGLQQTEPLGRVIKDGMVLALQPWIGTPDHQKGINIAETLAITETGPKQLGTRKDIEFIVV